MLPTDIDIAYFGRIKTMTPAERLSRCAAMLDWTRQQIALRLKQEDQSISPQVLKWKVALRLYQNEPEIVKLIESQLANVSS
jgi:hypothetical protein